MVECGSVFKAFAQNVLSKADVIQATGDAVCIFRELQCLTPRGRYVQKRAVNPDWGLFTSFCGFFVNV